MIKIALFLILSFSSFCADIVPSPLNPSSSVEGSISITSTGSSTWDFVNVQSYLSFGVNPSSESRLDSYEEGTWTPLDHSGAGLSITVNSASYTKIGRIVVAQFDVTYPATADVSQARIQGLPYTVGSGNHHGGFVTYTTNANLFSMTCSTATTSFYMYEAAGSDVMNNDLSSKSVRGTIVYTE